MLSHSNLQLEVVFQIKKKSILLVFSPPDVISILVVQSKIFLVDISGTFELCSVLCSLEC